MARVVGKYSRLQSLIFLFVCVSNHDVDERTTYLRIGQIFSYGNINDFTLKIFSFRYPNGKRFESKRKFWFNADSKFVFMRFSFTEF